MQANNAMLNFSSAFSIDLLFDMALDRGLRVLGLHRRDVQQLDWCEQYHTVTPRPILHLYVCARACSIVKFTCYIFLGHLIFVTVYIRP
jgi:hypothetical protein